MKHTFLFFFVFIFSITSFSQTNDTIVIEIIDIDTAFFEAGVSIDKNGLTFQNNREQSFISNIDNSKDFTIEASFEVLKKKSAYGIGFWNAYGGNAAGFLINEKGEYYLYLLFDGSSCILNGERSFEDWKNSEVILRKKGNINKLKIEKKDNIYCIFINNEELESYKLPDKFGNYYFTDFGILTEGKNIISKIHSFEINASKSK